MAFKVQIVNINENADNIILVSGLTIETLKIKYNWILNASVKNCILGQDDNGIVWFSGEWICGEWLDGTWYSGIWHNGTWKNGRWYSYLLDQAMIISNRFVILDKNETYSEFRSGTWKQGNFYDGTFGYDRNINGKSLNDLNDRNFDSAYWEDGNFHKGIFKNSVWYNGLFYNGNMIGSYWLYGKFYSGSFNYSNNTNIITWYNGLWYGGDFVEGDWLSGNFDQIDASIPSRFGLANDTYSRTTWHNGDFYNGQFLSGLNQDSSGNTSPSLDHSKSQWLNGNFRGGKWYGGHFNNGRFYNGNWYGGVFNTDTGSTWSTTCLWYNGNWYNGLWINGIFYDGHFYDGMWLDGKFINGYMSTNVIENTLLKQSLVTTVYPPTVTTSAITYITYNSAVGNGRVINNGGATILDRGMCWSLNQYPVVGNTYDNFSISDGGSMGSMNILLNGIVSGSTYFVRAYAINITGLTYGNQVSFTAKAALNSAPSVITNAITNIVSNSANVIGIITDSNGSTVTSCGFYYSTTNTNPNNTDIVIPVVPPVAPGEGSFNVTLPSLTSLTTYYVRAYATNGNGTSVGIVLSFTTNNTDPPVTPTVTTNSISNITDNTADVNGNVVNNGNSIITARGVCWSLSSNPTISDPKTTEAGDTGTFNTTMIGLLPNTTYHVRIYATNSAALTGYGVDMSFTTILSAPPTVIMIKCTPN